MNADEKLKSSADRAFELLEQKTPHQLAVELAEEQEWVALFRGKVLYQRAQIDQLAAQLTDATRRVAALEPQANAAHLAGHALGLIAGSDVTTKLAPAIKALVAEREALAALLREAEYEIGSTIYESEPDRDRADDLIVRIDAALAVEVPRTAEIAEGLLPDCTEVTRTAPKRIWLSVSDNPGYHNEPFPEHPYEIVGWLDSDMGGTRVEYVRADILAYGDVPT